MKWCAAAVLLLLYIVAWNAQRDKAEWADYYLSPATPAPLLRVASGYAKQLTGFGLFVKTSIFLGGTLQGVDKTSYADTLTQNFEVMTRLYPEFVDPYYYSQSFLPPIAPKYAHRTNMLLETAIEKHPDMIYFSFFQAFNNFYYLDEPVRAGEALYRVANRPGAPSWLGHLAGALMAQGGRLHAGRAMLQGMLEAEESDFMKMRYRKSIANFDKALVVQEALDRFRSDRRREPLGLQELVPQYLSALPQLEGGYVLVWEPPILRLERTGFKGAPWARQ